MSLMGFLDDILNPDSKEEAVERPCSNCPPDCPIAPAACDECREYKEKLVDLLYHVEHLDAYYDRYEVTNGAEAPSGTINCPYCGGPSSAALTVCEYCGMQLREGSAKIQVSSASEIPNPILEAQDLIFSRHEIVARYAREQSGSGGLLSGLLEAVIGEADDGFGGKMTEEEIKGVAAAYGVSVGSYLNGLDNGTYLTKSAKARKDQAAAHTSAPGVGLGAGMVGAATLFGMQHSVHPPRPPRPPVVMQVKPVAQQHIVRPPVSPQGMRPPHGGMPHGSSPFGMHQSAQGMRPPQGMHIQGARPGQGMRPGPGPGGRPGPGPGGRPGPGGKKGKR